VKFKKKKDSEYEYIQVKPAEDEDIKMVLL